MLGKHGVGECVQGQCAATVGIHHIVGQLDAARHFVNHRNQAVPLQHRVGDAWIEWLIGIYLVGLHNFVPLPSKGFMPGFVQQVHATHAYQYHLQHRVPYIHTGQYGSDGQQVVLRKQ